MYKKEKLILVVFFIFTVTGISLDINSQEHKITAEKILNRYIAACGGNELSKIQTEIRKGILIKGKTGKVPFTSFSTASGKWTYNQVFAFGDQVSYGFDGHLTWVADKEGVSEIDSREVLDIQMLFDIQLPHRLRNIFEKIFFKKMVKKENAEHIIFCARNRDNIQVELVFDKKSGLLLRSGDIYFSDYKKTGQVIRPHKIFIGHDLGGDNLRLMMEIQKFSFNESIDEKMFSLPLCPLKPNRSPLYTRRKQITVSNEILETFVGNYQQVDKPDNVFTIKRQENHLMMKTSRSPYFIEIKPETELDYFIRFLNIEVHFVKNKQGNVVCLEIGSGRNVTAKKINPK